MKKLFSFILISTLLISSSIAEEIFSDDFTTSDYISSTNLKHVTENGYLTIDNKGYYSNSIAVNDYTDSETTEYAVINNGKVEIYTLNEGNFNKIKTLEDIEGKISSPIGITYANDGHSIWILNENSLVKYDLNTGEDVVTKISGLSNVMGITSSKGYETVSILDSNGNVTGYKELIENEKMASVGALSITSSNAIISNPLAISAVGGTDNIVMMNNGQIAIYEYDDNSGLKGTNLNVSMGNSPFAISANENGFVLSNLSEVKYYTIEGIEDENRKVIYADENINNNVVGISLKQDKYEFVIVEEDGTVSYYDGEKMITNEGEQNRVELPVKLVLPGRYQSTEIRTSKNYDRIALTVEQENVEGYKINWYIDTINGMLSLGSSSNNYHTFSKDVTGDSFVIMGIIENTDSTKKYGNLPKIKDVTLDFIKKDEISGVEIIGVTKKDEDVDLTRFPVTVKRGSEVVIKVTTLPDVKSVDMEFELENGSSIDVEIKEMKKLPETEGVFIGSMILEPDKYEGETIYASFITDTGFEHYKGAFVNIESAVSYDLDLQIRQ